MPTVKQIPKRPYKDGVELSIVACGGNSYKDLPQDQVNALVARSIAQGVNYFDVAPGYGEAEVKLGIALAPYRDKVFLACKIRPCDGKSARATLERSLARLKTGHFDLYQLHMVREKADLEKSLGPGGTAEVLLYAKQKGMTRFLGFSTHTESIARTLLDGLPCPFDSILFPVNYLCYAHGTIGPALMKWAKERQMARLGIKALAYTPRPAEAPQQYPGVVYYNVIDDPVRADLAFRFALSEDITATIPPGDPGLFELCLGLAQRFKPLTPGERAALMAEAAHVEPFFKLNGYHGNEEAIAKVFAARAAQREKK